MSHDHCSWDGPKFQDAHLSSITGVDGGKWIPCGYSAGPDVVQLWEKSLLMRAEEGAVFGCPSVA